MGKRLMLLLAISVLIVIPAALALSIDGIADGMVQAVESILGIGDSMDDTIVIQLGMWIVLVFTLFKGAEKVFPEHRNAAVLVSLVIATIAMRFMPDDMLQSLAEGYVWLVWAVLALVLFLGPYILATAFADMLHLGRQGKVVIAVAIYIFMGFALTRSGVSYDFQSPVLNEMLYYLEQNPVVIVVGVIIASVVMWRWIYWREKEAGVYYGHHKGFNPLGGMFGRRH